MRGALRAGVNVDLPVLPVSKRTARLKRLMARVRRHKGFIEHQRRILEPCVDVTVRPFIGRFPHWQTPVLRVGELRLGPLERSDRGRRRGRRRSSRDGRRCRRLHPDVSVRSGIGATGPQGIERVDGEGKRFKLDSNLFNRFSGSELINRGHSENRFALVERFHGESPLALWVGPNHRTIVGERIGRRWKFVGRENRFHAGHCQRLAELEALHARMRQRAQQQLAEQHSFSVKVLRVLCLPCNFRVKVSRYVVLADQFVPSPIHTRSRCNRFGIVLRHGLPSSCSLRRASSRSESCRSPGTGTDSPRGPAPVRPAWGWDSSPGMPPPP